MTRLVMNVHSIQAAPKSNHCGAVPAAPDDKAPRRPSAAPKGGKIMSICVSPVFEDPFPEYGDRTDYADVFIEQMNCLYLLSFLVTADRQVAETCFSKAMDEYVDARGGFMDWAKHHGRLAVLRHAIQVIRPVPKQAYSWSYYEFGQPLVSAAHQPFAAITSLSAFERFVFVMSILEGLLEEECAALLNCDVQDVATGRELARKIIAAEDISSDLTGEMDLLFVPSLLSHQRCGIC